MLIYSLLHLTGYDLPMRELENFRQLHSKTLAPGVRLHPCVETTTGRWAWHRQRRRLRHRRAHRRRSSTARATTSLTTTPTPSWATAA